MASIGPGITIGGGISFTNPPPYVTQNLSLYYDPSNSISYPGSGNTVYDLSGNGLNGTMSNVTYTNPYFSFNGINSGITVLDNVLLEPGTGSFSIEMWYNMSFPSGDQYLLSKWTAPYNFNQLSYAIVRTSSNATYSWWGNGSTAVQNTQNGLTVDQWVQFVWVWSQSPKKIFVYANSSLTRLDDQNFTSILNSSTPITIGSLGGSALFYSGKIGVIRMYNKALSGVEVTKNWNATKSLYGL